MPKKTDIALSEILVEKGLLGQGDAEAFLRDADLKQVSFAQLIVDRGILLSCDLTRLLGEKLKLTVINLRDAVVDPAVISRIPVKISSYYKFIPIKLEDRLLTIAVSAPMDLKTQDEVRMQLGFDIAVVLSCESDIQDALKRYYGLAAQTLDEIAQGPQGGAMEQETEKIEDIEKLAQDASVIKIVNQIILEAYKKRATDIHIEPYREGLSLRYRVDGLLYDAHTPDGMRNYLNAIISRIKIMSNLNIVERRLPQDGRAVVKVQSQVLDLRISTIPTPHGESIVIRLLPTKMLFSLERLGLQKSDLQIFEMLIQKPHGIIFVTGPTGSGKTTTLYACLSRINTKERKIITIEDPIEYEMSGITQIQVSSATGLDFARGLRSMLRHDPDVMMVGEVRDVETAEIAIRVALTGHLVFSTLHTNDAASGITRLIDIGLEPYLLASSVEAFIAQRLVRVICESCKIEDTSIPVEVRSTIARDLGMQSISEVKIFKGKGCPSCNGTGFFGRTGIYEILLVDDAIEDLIVKKAPAAQITAMALSKGMRALRQDGWQKVLAGVTTPEEVMKVATASTRDSKTRYETPVPREQEALVEISHPASGADKRIFKRFFSTVNLQYKVVKSKDELLALGLNPEHLSVSKNISAGGVLFVAVEPLAIGSILELAVELPDGDAPVECFARIVRIEEAPGEKFYNVAVTFLDLTGRQRARLNQYVDEG